MKCSKAKKWISQFIDGDLDTRRSDVLKKHLERCQGCQELLGEFKGIAARSADLKEPVPPDSVWLKIQSGMNERKRPVRSRVSWWRDLFIFYPSFPRYAVSTAVVLALIVSLVVLVPRFWDSGKNLTGPEFALSKLEEAEYHYQKAIKALVEAASDKQQDFDPQTAVIFQKNLELIDTSITACRQAILSNPDSLESRDYLLTAFQRKAELLNLMMDFSTAPSYTQKTNKTL